MVGFNSLDKKQDWNGKLVSGNTVKEERDWYFNMFRWFTNHRKSRIIYF